MCTVLNTVTISVLNTVTISVLNTVTISQKIIKIDQRFFSREQVTFMKRWFLRCSPRNEKDTDFDPNKSKLISAMVSWDNERHCVGYIQHQSMRLIDYWFLTPSQPWRLYQGDSKWELVSPVFSRPDMTFAVYWALNNNYLFIYLSPVFSLERERQWVRSSISKWELVPPVFSLERERQWVRSNICQCKMVSPVFSLERERQWVRSNICQCKMVSPVFSLDRKRQWVRSSISVQPADRKTVVSIQHQ